ncbi:MAG: molecular chaperone DnaK, partial [Chloroflexi bacterium]|nr:molecular chaperone DnaK [Chloroflexota bacterium]
AEEHATEDAARRETVEVINTGDSLAYSAEKMLNDNASVITDEQHEEVRTAISELRDVLRGEDVTSIRSKTETLSAAMQAVGAAIYGAQQAANAPGGGGGNGADRDAGEGEPDTVEGEFREV